MPPDTCPNCGADLPRNAKACPACGADESAGWSETADAGSLGLPAEDFDYQKFVRHEFGAPSPKPPGLRWFWWVVALLVLAGMIRYLVL